MGVHICVYQKIEKEFTKVPTDQWDWIRQGYDRDFSFKTETEYENGYPDDERSDFFLSRPKDIEAERATFSAIPEQYRQRYDHLLNLLRDHSDYWVHWSY